ncbi:FkbM family methyltransferase [Agrobacterium larrymoorei]|uniref:FkbM family methyltransferase n=1 Tax=Agrobacterium larrymoorei TaxID=160699 RepID=UPI001573D7A8|nr:FkbM family methyltransferase [Agrobacterium larrymoorei]NTJ43918.1 FkbM family methyltransferase [Agrobacterium larrymoorei]
MKWTDRLESAVGLTRSLIIYYGQPWRRAALRRFYGSLIEPGDLVFDIGAHVGSRSRTLLDIGARVVAAEPQPVFANLLEYWQGGQLQGLERVAVGGSVGEVELYVSRLHPTVTSVSSEFVQSVGNTNGFRSVSWDQKLRVPMTTLDVLITKYGRPAFCKIDVEGAEGEVLAGLSSTIPLVAFEYIPAMQSVTRASIDMLLALGDYEFNRVSGETHLFASEQWMSGQEMISELALMSLDDPSGDIYARLKQVI